jgi:hypothetical protein
MRSILVLACTVAVIWLTTSERPALAAKKQVNCERFTVEQCQSRCQSKGHGSEKCTQVCGKRQAKCAADGGSVPAAKKEGIKKGNCQQFSYESCHNRCLSRGDRTKDCAKRCGKRQAKCG